MKLLKPTIVSAALLLGTLASGLALAHGRHFHHHHPRFGVFIGGPIWNSWYYPPAPYYPYYYPYRYPPVVASPPVYIEKDDEPAGGPSQQSSWWYFCRESSAYYPYVRECPGGWQQVAPQPPPR
jgi:hypothetical protein